MSGSMTKNKPKIALQLYTVRNECAGDFEGTLRRVAEMGYDGVELAGFHGWSASRLKRTLEGFRLEIAASLVPIDDIVPSLDDHLELGCDYIVVPAADPEHFRNAAKLDELAGRLRAIGAACRARGIRLGYHNHDFDVRPRIDGEPALFRLYAELEGDGLLAEPDVYWLRKGGADEIGTLLRYKGRIPNVHLKDMAPDGRYAPVGSGILDMKAVIRAAMEAEVRWLVVEQDNCYGRSPFDCAEESLDYIRSLGLW